LPAPKHCSELRISGGQILLDLPQRVVFISVQHLGLLHPSSRVASELPFGH